jgi:hypothetical protein
MLQQRRWHLFGVAIGLGFFLVCYALGGHAPRGDTTTSRARVAASSQYLPGE